MHNSFISIIIPVLNAEKHIEQCLAAIRKLDYPKDMLEVIVVDNGSTDKTTAIVQRSNAKLFIKKNCSVSALRNVGVAQSKGDVIAFIDADCVVPTTWLRSALKLFQKDSVGAVGCWYALPPEASYWEKVWDIYMGRRRQVWGSINWVPGGNLVIKRAVFEMTKGFNESLISAAEVDFCQRIVESGKILYSHSALAVEHWGNPKTIEEFFYKELLWGKGIIQVCFNKVLLRAFIKEMSLAVSYAVLWIGIVVGTLLGIVGDSWVVASMSGIGFIGIPFILALRNIIQRRQVRNLRYCMVLMFMHCVSGIGRALSLYDVFLFLSIIRKREGIQ